MSLGALLLAAVVGFVTGAVVAVLGSHRATLNNKSKTPDISK